MGLKDAVKNMRAGPKGADLELQRLNHEHNKLQETVGYLFKRTKSLSSVISQFYEKHCTDVNYLNVTQEYVLSYENTLKKLEDIFSKFEYMKENTRKITNHKHLGSPGHKSLTPDDRSNNREDVKLRYRSKSPTPYNNYDALPDPKKLEDLDKEFLKDETKLNRYFKKNVPFI